MAVLPGTGIGVDTDYKWKFDEHGKMYLAHITGIKFDRSFHGKKTLLSIDKHYRSEITTNENTIVFYFFVPIEACIIHKFITELKTTHIREYNDEEGINPSL